MIERNAIIGLAYNYSLKNITPFLESLHRSSFTGDLVLFVNHPLTIEKKYSFNIIINNPSKKLAHLIFLQITIRRFVNLMGASSIWHKKNKKRVSEKIMLKKSLTSWEFSYMHANFYLATMRFTLYYDYLLRFPYKAVFFTDVNDVIFQGDIFSKIKENKVVYFQERDDQFISQQWSNSRWIREGYGSDVLTDLGPKVINCSGTILADYSGAMKFLSDYTLEITQKPFPTHLPGLDQGIYNYMLYLGNYSYFVPSKNGEIIYTIGTEDEDNIEIVDGLIKPKIISVVPVVVHQYNRHKAITNFIEEVYS
jgi:hypothetical protein